MTRLHTHDVQVGDYSIHVNETGDRSLPTVLWLHGSGPGVSALSNWERLITQLMPGFRNIAPDVLGFGQSSHPEDPPRGTTAYTELRAEVIVGLLDALSLDRVHVVGNSMGGMIALRLLQLYPARFDRAVLMGSGGAPEPPTPALIKMVRFYDDPPAAMRSLLSNFTYDPSAFSGDLDAIAEDRVRKATRPEVKRSHLATFDPAGQPLAFQPGQLAAITNEILVTHGREDRILPVENSYYFARHLPNAQLHVLPHAGHWMQLEQAERFAAQAEIFFREKPRAQT